MIKFLLDLSAAEPLSSCLGGASGIVSFRTADLLRATISRLPYECASGSPLLLEQRAESINLSERGIFFATDWRLREGKAVEVLLKMPEEITGEPTTEWRCTGLVVCTGPVESLKGKIGVGVHFDCYEVSRGPEHDMPVGAGACRTSFPI